MSKTCYAIAAYLGERHLPNPRQQADRWYLLHRHLTQLRAVSHSLDQVVVVLSSDAPAESERNLVAAFCRYRGIEAEVIIRHNLGYSYGAWSDAFAQYGERFDYYILVEDDYLPVADDFDQRLREMIDAFPRCGYLCGLVNCFPMRSEGDIYAVPHGSISNGIARATAMTAIAARLQGQPAYMAGHEYRDGWRSQIRFTNAFLYAGYELRDWTERYSTPYNEEGRVVIFGDSRLPALLAPVEYLEHGPYTAEELRAMEVPWRMMEKQ